MAGIRNGHICKNLSQKVNPRDIAGNEEEKEEKQIKDGKLNYD